MNRLARFIAAGLVVLGLGGTTTVACPVPMDPESDLLADATLGDPTRAEIIERIAEYANANFVAGEADPDVTGTAPNEVDTYFKIIVKVLHEAFEAEGESRPDVRDISSLLSQLTEDYFGCASTGGSSNPMALTGPGIGTGCDRDGDGDGPDSDDIVLAVAQARKCAGGAMATGWASVAEVIAGVQGFRSVVLPGDPPTVGCSLPCGELWLALGMMLDPSTPIPYKDFQPIGTGSGCDPGDACDDAIEADLGADPPAFGSSPCGRKALATDDCDRDGDSQSTWRDIYILAMEADLCRLKHADCGPIPNHFEGVLGQEQAARDICAAIRRQYGADCAVPGSSDPCDFMTDFGDNMMSGMEPDMIVLIRSCLGCQSNECAPVPVPHGFGEMALSVPGTRGDPGEGFGCGDPALDQGIHQLYLDTKAICLDNDLGGLLEDAALLTRFPCLYARRGNCFGYPNLHPDLPVAGAIRGLQRIMRSELGRDPLPTEIASMLGCLGLQTNCDKESFDWGEANINPCYFYAGEVPSSTSFPLKAELGRRLHCAQQAGGTLSREEVLQLTEEYAGFLAADSGCPNLPCAWDVLTDLFGRGNGLDAVPVDFQTVQSFALLSGCDPKCETVSGLGCKPDLEPVNPCDMDGDGSGTLNDPLYYAMEVDLCSRQIECANHAAGYSSDPFTDNAKLNAVCDFLQQCAAESLPVRSELGCSALERLGSELLLKEITPEDLERLENCSGCNGADSLGETPPNQDPGSLSPDGGNLPSDFLPRGPTPRYPYGGNSGPSVSSVPGTGGSGSTATLSGCDSSGGSNPATGNPVDLWTGAKLESAVDISVPVTRGEFVFSRQYTSSTAYTGASLIGNGWMSPHFAFLGFGAFESDESITLAGPPMNRSIKFARVPSTNVWRPTANGTQLLEPVAVGGSLDLNTCTWRLTEPGRGTIEFAGRSAAAWARGRITKRTDLYGNSEIYAYTDQAVNPSNLPTQTNARLRSITLKNDASSVIELEVRFAWHRASGESTGDGALVGKLASIVVLRPSGSDLVEIQRVSYRYKASDDGLPTDVGSSGDLIDVANQTIVDRAPSGVSPFWARVTQYRYYTTSTAIGNPSPATDARLALTGSSHQIRAVYLPEQIEFFAQQLGVYAGHGPETALAKAASLLRTRADHVALGIPGELAGLTTVDLASKVVGYDSANRVAVEYLQAGCGCSGGGQNLKQVLTYYPSSSTTWASSDWRTVRIAEVAAAQGTSETTSAYRTKVFDLSRHAEVSDIVFLDSRALIEDAAPTGVTGTRTWVWKYEYAETSGNKTAEFTPAAIADYEAATATTQADATPRSADGLVARFAYNGDHRLTHLGVSKGIGGTTIWTQAVTYDVSGKPQLPSKIERFRTDASSPSDEDIETIHLSYGFHGSTDAIRWVQTSVEKEREQENGEGDGSASTGNVIDSFDVFDTHGRLVWTGLADKTLIHRAYESRTGRVSAITRNAETTVGSDALSSLSSGLVTTDWGANDDISLTTSFTYDLVGRRRSTVAPGGIAHYSRRELLPVASRPGTFYLAVVHLPHAYETPTSGSPVPGVDGPAQITWASAALEEIESRTYAVPPASYDPTAVSSGIPGFVTYAVTSGEGKPELSRRSTKHTYTGLVTAETVYTDLHLNGAGNPIGETTSTYTYDALGRLYRVVGPTGDATELFDFDAFDRPLAMRAGRGTGSELTTVAEYFYDDPDTDATPEQSQGGLGRNGLLNHVVQYPSESEARITSFVHDWRMREMRVIAPAPPHTAVERDNLGRVTRRLVVSDASRDLDIAIDTADIGAATSFAFSQRGLLYRSGALIDPATPSHGELAVHRWFDAMGRPIAVWGPNAPATKITYDALGRRKQVAITDRGGDVAPGTSGSYADAKALTGDLVLEQTDIAYADSSSLSPAYRQTGMPLVVTTRKRFHDDTTTTGDLSASSGTKAVTTFVGMVYDGAGRVVKVINYGVNLGSTDSFRTGGTAPTPPATIVDTTGLPSWALSATAHYNSRGALDLVTDPAGRATKYFYDDATRRIAVVENYQDATLTWDAAAFDYVPGGLGATGADDVDRMTRVRFDAAGRTREEIAYERLDGGIVRSQVTAYVWGARETDGSLIDSDNLLAAVLYPSEATGQPITSTSAEGYSAHRVKYTYNALGELLTATDQNETTHTYTRDALGRATVDEATITSAAIDGTIDTLQSEFDDFGRLKFATSRNGGPSGTIRDQVEFAYTSLWQVAGVQQNAFGAISGGGGNIRSVTYTYTANSAAEAANHSRMTRMTMPHDEFVGYAYGASPGLNDTISRVTAIDFGHGSASTPAAGTLAEYGYLGAGNIVSTSLNPSGGGMGNLRLDATYTHEGKWRTDPDSGDRTTEGFYDGLDRFGRTSRHAWFRFGTGNRSSGIPLMPAVVERQYGYDASGNRTTDADARVGARFMGRDRVHVYDELNRLTETRRTSVEEQTAPAPDNPDWRSARSQRWALDTLGNWKEVETVGPTNDTGDYVADDKEVRAHNAANQITELMPSGGGSPPVLPFLYDAAGNMTQRAVGSTSQRKDHVFDAWNRLVAVKRVPAAVGETEPGSGVITVQRSRYNALHWRVISEEAAALTGESDEPPVPAGPTLRRVMVYDASWRLVHEDVYEAPVSITGTAPSRTFTYTAMPALTSACDSGWLDRQCQTIYGIRALDDIVARRVFDGGIVAADHVPRGGGTGTGAVGLIYLTDPQGSVLAIVDAGGRVIERLDYDSFGTPHHALPENVNERNGVDPDDLADYIDWYFASGPDTGDADYSLHVDWNADGTVDPDDLSDYIAAYTAFGTAGHADTLPGELALQHDHGGQTLGLADNIFGWCGYVYDHSSELYCVRHRHFDPSLGRWLQRDPAGFMDSMNLYGYGWGSPVGVVDPTGRDAEGGSPGSDPESNTYRDKMGDITDAIKRQCSRYNIRVADAINHGNLAGLDQVPQYEDEEEAYATPSGGNSCQDDDNDGTISLGVELGLATQGVLADGGEVLADSAVESLKIQLANRPTWANFKANGELTQSAQRLLMRGNYDLLRLGATALKLLGALANIAGTAVAVYNSGTHFAEGRNWEGAGAASGAAAGVIGIGLGVVGGLAFGVPAVIVVGAAGMASLLITLTAEDAIAEAFEIFTVDADDEHAYNSQKNGHCDFLLQQLKSYAQKEKDAGR